AAEVTTIIVSHMHYDHVGNYDLFPRARYHLQDCEMAYATGRCMCHTALRMPFEVDDVVAMVRKVFAGRVAFHDGKDEIVPGVTVHHIGGHSKGLQSVRVKTRRGQVVLAADAAHLYAHLDSGRIFPITYNVAEVAEGYETLKKLASSPNHVVPGHDPLVLARYPAAKAGLEGWVGRAVGWGGEELGRRGGGGRAAIPRHGGPRSPSRRVPGSAMTGRNRDICDFVALVFAVDSCYRCQIIPCATLWSSPAGGARGSEQMTGAAMTTSW